MVVEAKDQHGDTLIANLCVCGVWLPQAVALFSICVVYTDSQSYFHEFCCMQKLKAIISMQKLVLLDVLILHLFLSLWMA